MTNFVETSNGTGPDITPVPDPMEVLDRQLPAHLEKRCRSWFLTWNNYPDDAKDRLESLGPVRAVVGKEVAPSTGTPHLQGFLRFDAPKRGTTICKACKGIWIKPAFSEKGSIKYCAKDGELLLEVGEDQEVHPKVSERDATVIDVMKSIDSGKSIQEIRRKHPVFCFWHIDKVKRYKKDNERYGVYDDGAGSDQEAEDE